MLLLVIVLVIETDRICASVLHLDRLERRSLGPPPASHCIDRENDERDPDQSESHHLRASEWFVENKNPKNKTYSSARGIAEIQVSLGASVGRRTQTKAAARP